ncbi:MAG: GNAT family N-acetyltransferase [Clostridiales bacterium]|nr:GNAT family N-acetyltransferase [Clostridiales bacterium]
MVRKLEEKDRKDVLEFLNEEPAINLFLIGDIETNGFEEEFQTLWGQYTEEGILEGVLLRYYKNFIPYFVKPNFDITEFSKIILSKHDDIMISGKESILRRFEGILPKHKSDTFYFCELRSLNELSPNECNSNTIKIAQVCDAERVYDFMNNIAEFEDFNATVDIIKQKIKTKSGRIYYIENEDGLMVSSVQTTAENSKSAMVVGVATLKEYRNKGLMSQCLAKLCLDIVNEGKGLCLFYDNPRAGSIYHKFGFKTIDSWMVIKID